LRKCDLIRQIDNIFKDIPYPGDENIVDNPSHCPECKEVSKAFNKKHWKEVLLELEFSLMSFLKFPAIIPDSFLLLTSKAFQFYLPAFLIYCIDKIDSISQYDKIISDKILRMIDIIIFKLNYLPNIKECFNIQQRRIIKEFLEYILDKGYDNIDEIYKLLKKLNK
jgi:hypothetical protein